MGFTQHFSRPAAVIAAALLAASVTGCAPEFNKTPESTADNTATTSSSTASGAAKSSTASSTASASSTEQAASAQTPDCSTAALQANPSYYDMEFVACAGGFGKAMVPQSDVGGFVQWTGEGWEGVTPDGEFHEGLGGVCYNSARLDQLGVPSEVRSRVYECENVNAKPYQPYAPTPEPQSSGGPFFQNGIIVSAGLGEAGEDASYPPCDGRNILILDSVIDHGNSGGAMDDIAQQVLMQHPSGMDVRFMVPGHCPSLRAQLDGSNIYPIYLDFGQDAQAMCRAKAAYGGNGRVLSNAAEFVDPC